MATDPPPVRFTCSGPSRRRPQRHAHVVLEPMPARNRHRDRRRAVASVAVALGPQVALSLTPQAVPTLAPMPEWAWRALSHHVPARPLAGGAREYEVARRALYCTLRCTLGKLRDHARLRWPSSHPHSRILAYHELPPSVAARLALAMRAAMSPRDVPGIGCALADAVPSPSPVVPGGARSGTPSAG